jgi:hypothetical protein
VDPISQPGGATLLAGTLKRDFPAARDFPLNQRVGHCELIGHGLAAPAVNDRAPRADGVAGDADQRGAEAPGSIPANRSRVDFLK